MLYEVITHIGITVHDIRKYLVGILNAERKIAIVSKALPVHLNVSQFGVNNRLNALRNNFV